MTTITTTRLQGKNAIFTGGIDFVSEVIATAVWKHVDALCGRS
jgi:hypothetical protein